MIVIMTKMQTKTKRKIFPPQFFFFVQHNRTSIEMNICKMLETLRAFRAPLTRICPYLHALKIQSNAFISSPYIQCKYISQIKVTKLDGTAYPQNSQENTFTPNSLECHV